MRCVRVALTALLAGSWVLAGCSSGSLADAGTASGPAPAPTPAGKVMVGAGTALTEAFTAIATDFEAATPGAEVTFTFDSSVSLSNQILNGASIDVYAAPKDANLQRLVTAGRVGTPTPFATTSLVIITKPGNPARIKSLADLAEVDVVALGSTSIPCGNLAEQVLQRSGVAIAENRVTRGQTVKAVLTAVSQGDATAGIVFASDAEAAAGHVATVTVPAASNATATLAIAPVLAHRGDRLAPGATAFITWVLGPDGQQVLARAGFGPKP